MARTRTRGRASGKARSKKDTPATKSRTPAKKPAAPKPEVVARPARARSPEAAAPGRMTETVARRATGIADDPIPHRDEIARRAYEIWCAAGRPEGRDQEHWFAAERALILEIKPWAGIAAVDRD